jgi:hypothetical protein
VVRIPYGVCAVRVELSDEIRIIGHPDPNEVFGGEPIIATRNNEEYEGHRYR